MASASQAFSSDNSQTNPTLDTFADIPLNTSTDVPTNAPIEALPSPSLAQHTLPAATIPTGTIIAPNISNLVHISLKDSNYMVWKTLFSTFLRSHDLLGFVDGSRPCPPVTDPLFASRYQIDDNISLLLFSNLSEQILEESPTDIVAGEEEVTTVLRVITQSGGWGGRGRAGRWSQQWSLEPRGDRLGGRYNNNGTSRGYHQQQGAPVTHLDAGMVVADMETIVAVMPGLCMVVGNHPPHNIW
ncbi:hypothetical protein CRG98_039412 [Punica granatum]|uniref:Retrotransposon Copia-like N-terminal domain-containing protein n=1 Tax=Punica granatum TaxID=22663 RepID=A0A2I0I888_PUNGR|nr:hypothetical protein CRG98_039412 [Punica granatum]